MGRPFLTKLLLRRTRMDRHARLQATRLLQQVIDVVEESLDGEPLPPAQRDAYIEAICEALAWSNSHKKQVDDVLALLRPVDASHNGELAAPSTVRGRPTSSGGSRSKRWTLTSADLLQGALVAAVATGDTDRVHALIERGALADGDGALFGSPLASAARRGLNPMEAILAQRGASFTPARGGQYFSPLIDAAAAGQVATVRGLLNCASFEMRCDDPVRTLENGFERALRFAVGNGHTEIVTLLVDKLQTIDLQGLSRFRRAVEDWRKGVIQLAFLDACRYGRRNLVELLLSKGAGLNVSMGPRGTGIHNASRGGHIEILRLLLDLGAEPVRSAPPSFSIAQPVCREPICLAARHDHKHVVQFWLDAGIDIDNRNGMFSPLLEAAFEDQISMVRFLLSRNADLKIKDCGRQALHYAVGQGFESMVQLLIEHGVDPDGLPNDIPSEDDETDSEGYSDSDIPMLQAMIRGQDHIVRLLLRLGAKQVDPAHTDYADRFKEGFYPRSRA